MEEQKLRCKKIIMKKRRWWLGGDGYSEDGEISGFKDSLQEVVIIWIWKKGIKNFEFLV